MNKTTRFILSKLCAVALIALGIHLMAAYMAKELPFSIVTESIGIWGVWAYMGWLFSFIPMVGGFMKLFEEPIERWLNELERR